MTRSGEKSFQKLSREKCDFRVFNPEEPPKTAGGFGPKSVQNGLFQNRVFSVHYNCTKSAQIRDLTPLGGPKVCKMQDFLKWPFLRPVRAL